MRRLNLGFEGLAMSLKLQLVVVSHLLRLLHEVVLQIQQALLVKGDGPVGGGEVQQQQQEGRGNCGREQQQLKQQNSRLHEKLLENETAVYGEHQEREEGEKTQEEQQRPEQESNGKQEQQQQQRQEGQKQKEKHQQGREEGKQNSQQEQVDEKPKEQQEQQQGGQQGGIGTVEALQMKADGILWVSLASLLPVLESLATLWHSVGVLAGNQDCQESARVTTGSSADSELLRVLSGNRGTGSSSSSNSRMAEDGEARAQLSNLVCVCLRRT